MTNTHQKILQDIDAGGFQAALGQLPGSAQESSRYLPGRYPASPDGLVSRDRDDGLAFRADGVWERSECDANIEAAPVGRGGENGGKYDTMFWGSSCDDSPHCVNGA